MGPFSDTPHPPFVHWYTKYGRMTHRPEPVQSQSAARPASALSHVSCGTGGHLARVNNQSRSRLGRTYDSHRAGPDGYSLRVSMFPWASLPVAGDRMSIMSAVTALLRRPGLWAYMTRRAELSYFRERDVLLHSERMVVIDRLKPGAVMTESGSGCHRRIWMAPQPSRSHGHESDCRKCRLQADRLPNCRIR